MSLNREEAAVLSVLTSAGLRGHTTAPAAAEEAMVDLHRIEGVLRSLEERGLARRNSARTWCCRAAALREAV